MTPQEIQQRLQEMDAERVRWVHSNAARAGEIAAAMMQLAEGAGPGARALAWRAHATNLRVAGKLTEALAAVRTAQKLWREAGDEVEWARTITAAIPILVQLDRNGDAVRLSKVALALFLKRGEMAAAARLLNNMGSMYGNMGRPAPALDCFTRGAELASQTNQPDLAARLNGNRALVLGQMGRHEESLSASARALRHWTAVKAGIGAARALMTGAIALYHLGRFGKALRRFAGARELFSSESVPRDVAVCDLYIAACYLELNRYDQVLSRVQAVIEVLHPEQYGFQHAWAWMYQGVALGHLGRREEARICLVKAHRWFEEHRHTAWAAKAHLEEAELLRQSGECRAVIKAAGAAARLFGSAEMPVEQARAQLLAAEANFLAGRLAAAEREAERAYPVLLRSHMPGPLFRCLHLQGRIAMRRRRRDEARRLLTRAVDTAERMRATVHLPFRRAFLDDKSSAYADLVWLHLTQGRMREAYRLADLAKSRGLLDELLDESAPARRRTSPRDVALLDQIEAARREYQALWLTVQLGPEEAVALRGGAATQAARRSQLEARLARLWDEWELRQTATLATLRGAAPAARSPHRLLPAGAEMVEYFVAGARLIAFVSDRRGLRGWVDLGAPESVRRTLELIQLNLDTTLLMSGSGRVAPGLARNARALLQELHAQLWAPLLPLLGRRQQVVIIPHGVLHLVPFEALYDGERYLVQQMEISLAPSRATWLHCMERGARPAGEQDLVLGYNPEGALPFVDTEAAAVAEGLATVAHTGQAASVARLSEAGTYRVVHLSVHGEFRQDNPHFSTLLLADGALTVAEAAALRLGSSLVVLSGCETGLSHVTRGEELMGMVSAFLQAGSASVLASRWRVEDRVTASLMERFYAELLAGAGKAASLRTAQTAFAEADVHPLYWAAFGLIGHSGPLASFSHTWGGDEVHEQAHRQ